MLRGNRGEWSEVYVLFRLLADGAVTLVDSNLIKLPGDGFRIERVIRHESQGDVTFKSGDIGVTVELDGKNSVIPRETFRSAADHLLKVLLNTQGKISDVRSEELLTRLRLRTLKASATRKADIGFVVTDPYLGELQELEMSIKSQLGSSATLFNASGYSTNFRFIAHSFKGSVESLPQEDTTVRSVSQFVKTLITESAFVGFLGMRNKKFENNLRMIDMKLPEILGAMLLKYFGTPSSSVASITDALIEDDPLGVGTDLAPLLYPHKVKCFLVDCALGLKTGKPWNGSYSANGGYIIVRSDGSLACIHAFNRDNFQEYLFKSTRLEGPSSNRHKYGFVAESSKNPDGTFDILFDLNLQVRFK